MEDGRVTLGSIENLVVDVTDRVGSLVTLTGTNARYDIRKYGATGWEVQNGVVINVGMRAFCLLDTSAWAETKIGKYQLYIHFDNIPEHPRLGPYEFRVDK